MVSQQYNDLFLKHPLMLTICKEFGQARIADAEYRLAQYEGRPVAKLPEQKKTTKHPDSEPFVFAHIVSSWGKVDAHLPSTYKDEGDKLLFDIVDIEPHLRCRPTEF